MANSVDNRSLGELFSDLSRETTTLVRQELELAKAEMSEKATEAGKNVGFLAVGGAIVYAAFLFILAAIVIGLAGFMPPWLSALIVGLVVGGIGFFLVQRGLSALRQSNLVPQKTINTLREDKEWVQRQVQQAQQTK
jgi:hypothetical protein